ncbi:MAG: tetratricopeptide repeat protein, partial [Chitinophagaceae bacterium]|nr:tetratricopeptide repeat protein [Chitinophagaceae bacterium]
MKAKLALERANVLIKNNDYKSASKELSKVVPSKAISKYTRQRAAFLNGQLQYEIGMYDSAVNSFKKSLALHPPIEMDFYARKYTAEAVALSGTDPSTSLSSLKKLLKDGKYAPYHEQVYFILGKLSANDGKYDNAIGYYQKSLRQAKTTPKQKAISFASMGNIQYKMGQFNNAKKSYDSASYFAKFAKNNAELALALRRGKSLSKIEEPYNALYLNDSLLKLSKLSEKEQKAVVKKYLRFLEKQKEDSISNIAQNASAGSLANATNNNGGSSNWYFGSTVAVQQGFNEFKRKWGNRTLNDNWRRASASAFGASQAAKDADNSDTSSTIDNELTEESLLAAIPKSEKQLLTLNQNIKRAYVDLSSAYIKDLEEFLEGQNAIDSLVRRYPDHEYKDEVLYLQYTAALRQSNLELAETIRQKLLTDYPTSSFAAKLISTTDDALTTSNNAIENVSTYYEAPYQMLQAQAYQEVISKVNVAKRTYGDQNYSRKFRVIEAQAYAALGNYQRADSIVADYVKEYPSDSLRPWIDAIRKNTSLQKAADTLAKDSLGNKTAVSVADTSSTSKTTAATGTDAMPRNYLYEPSEPHYCVFIFGKADAKVSGFRSGISDFAKIKFSGISLSSEVDVLNLDESMVITKGFGNAGQCKIFMTAAKNEHLLFREMTANSFQYFIISEQNYLRLKAEKAKENYLIFYKRRYK